MQTQEGEDSGLAQRVDWDDARSGSQGELDVALVLGEDALLDDCGASRVRGGGRGGGGGGGGGGCG